MAYKKKQVAVMPVHQINTKRKYVITEKSFSGHVNNSSWSGKQGEIVEMEPWEAKLLCAYVKEAE